MRPRALVLVAIAACGAPAAPIAPRDDATACQRVLPAAIDRVVLGQAAELPAELRAQLDALAARMKLVMVERCAADRWSAAALRCLGAARVDADFAACDPLFTPTQKAAVDAAMRPPPAP
jgi:hypothetical protein